ncbi:putative membrane protein [Escherichia coli DEC6C]|nr:putative membrane protein [Escherichia coli DEC6C]
MDNWTFTINKFCEKVLIFWSYFNNFFIILVHNQIALG